MSETSEKCAVWARSVGSQMRVKYFMQKAATNIIGEAPATAGHAERLIYAKKILDGSASILEYAIAVSTNSTVAASIVSNPPDGPIDSELELTVNSMVNDFAGYEAS